MLTVLPIDKYYSKTCLKRHSKIDKTKVLMANGSLMKVESIAECSKKPWSILVFSGRYHIISDASLVNNYIILT